MREEEEATRDGAGEGVGAEVEMGEEGEQAGESCGNGAGEVDGGEDELGEGGAQGAQGGVGGEGAVEVYELEGELGDEAGGVTGNAGPAARGRVGRGRLPVGEELLTINIGSGVAKEGGLPGEQSSSLSQCGGAVDGRNNWCSTREGEQGEEE